MPALRKNISRGLWDVGALKNVLVRLSRWKDRRSESGEARLQSVRWCRGAIACLGQFVGVADGSLVGERMDCFVEAFVCLKRGEVCVRRENRTCVGLEGATRR